MNRSPVGRVSILAQRQPVDQALFEEFAAAECTALGVDAEVQWIDDLTGVLDVAMAAAQRREPLVVVTAPGAADLVQLPAELAPWTVRVDLSLRAKVDLTHGRDLGYGAVAAMLGGTRMTSRRRTHRHPRCCACPSARGSWSWSGNRTAPTCER